MSDDRRFGPDDRPTGADDVEIAVFEGEAVLFHESAKMVHLLNAVAGATWLCCDGDTTVTGIVDELVELFGDDIDRPTLTDSVHDALERFADEGLLTDQAAPIRLPLRRIPQTADDGTEILTPDDP